MRRVAFLFAFALSACGTSAAGTSAGSGATTSGGGASGGAVGSTAAGSTSGGASSGAGTSSGAGGSSGSTSGGMTSGSSGSGSSSSSGSTGGSPSPLHVSGNVLADATNTPVQLHGVNRSGTEYACIQGWGIFDGPSDDASVAQIAAWNANVVRLPLNEDCWLAINGVNSAYSGAAYKQAIQDYVALLHQHGLYAIVELHWTAPGTDAADRQRPLPDHDHAPAFWADVASTFKDDGAVLLELFNEPFPDGDQDTSTAWSCWKDGCTVTFNDSSVSPTVNETYQAAGMQELLDAVRGAGAHNVVLLGGVQYSNALSGWLSHEPTDPDANLAAAWHVYSFNACSDVTCYNQLAGPVAAQVPIVTTEIGEDDGAHTFIDGIMGWLDARNDSYLAWTWDTWGPPLSLIDDYGTGHPATAYGQGYKDHLATRP